MRKWALQTGLASEHHLNYSGQAPSGLGIAFLPGDFSLGFDPNCPFSTKSSTDYKATYPELLFAKRTLSQVVFIPPETITAA